MGTGMEIFITSVDARNHNIYYLFIEIDKNVMIRVVEKAEALKLDNLRLVLLDANHLNDYFQVSEVDKIYLNFSDPWPKNRHAKRRLTHSTFLTSYKSILREDAIVEFK